MSNYSELSNDALQLEVARRLGYEYQQNAPKGHFCLTVGNDKGWWKVPGEKEWTCSQCYDVLPDWPGSIADAWGLVEEMGRDTRITRATNDELAERFGEWCCVGGDTYGAGFAPTAPRAIVIAWLMWKDAQEEAR